jgi:hypothetical protein
MDASMVYLRSLSPVVIVLLLGAVAETASGGDTLGTGLATRRRSTERAIISESSEEPRALPRSSGNTTRSRVQGSNARANFVSHELGTMHKADRIANQATGKVRRTSGYEFEGDVLEEGGCADGSCGSDGSCGDALAGDCDDGSCGTATGWVGGSLFGRILTGAEYSSGMQSFYGPANRGGAGSAGFHQGINLAMPVFEEGLGVGLQGGVLFTQSNMNGALFTNDSRNQVFATVGGFRRVDWGFQWGLVVDYMHDDWYYQVNLHQLRGEMSWKMPEGGEVGFTFTNGLGTDLANSVVLTNGIPATTAETWVVNDMYTFFARHTFQSGFEGRIFAGFTGDSDGILGGNFDMPVFDNWSVRTDVMYMNASQGKFDGGVLNESWNMAVSLVWNPCGYNSCGNYYRPLFNVANNNTFLVDRR